VRDPVGGWVLAAHSGFCPFARRARAHGGIAVSSSEKQRLAFGLASSGGWVGAGDMAGDGLGTGPGVALEAGVLGEERLCPSASRRSAQWA
jgi:hypothetical protein